MCESVRCKGECKALHAVSMAIAKYHLNKRKKTAIVRGESTHAGSKAERDGCIETIKDATIRMVHQELCL